MAQQSQSFDPYTRKLFASLYDHSATAAKQTGKNVDAALVEKVRRLLAAAENGEGTGPIVRLFASLVNIRQQYGVGPERFDIARDQLEALDSRHEQIDEHLVSIGGRVGQALPHC